MTDLELAKENLFGHTLSLCKDGKLIFSDLKGISPIINFIDGGADLSGYSVADTVVGKAAALMFVKCGICAVYASVLSEGGKKVLKAHKIPFECGALTARIVNRAGTDACPMEKAVINTEDAEEAYVLIKKQLDILKNQ